jgi:hypothetical protein
VRRVANIPEPEERAVARSCLAWRSASTPVV